MSRTVKSILVLLLTAILAACALFMLGPQIMIVVPTTIVAGLVLAIRRSFLSLACFGYPFTFGLASAYIGYTEIPDYTQTSTFAVSIIIGVAGVGLIAAGLWKALPSKTSDKKR